MAHSDLPNVYVGGLHFKTTKETLIAHFSKFGDVKSAVVITEPGPEGKSKGYGFVNYFNIEDRDKALAVSHELDGRPLSCSIAKESNKNRGMGGMGGGMSMVGIDGGMGGGGMGGGGMGGGGMGGGGMYGAPQYGQKDDDAKKVFLGGLHSTTETQDIEQALSEFGKVNYTIIKKDRETNRSRGFGFVTFDKADDAAKARKQQYVHILDKRVEIKSVNPSASQSQGYGYGNGNMFGQGNSFGGSGYDSSYQYAGGFQGYTGNGGNSSNWQNQGSSWQGAGGDSSWNSSGYGSNAGSYGNASTGTYSSSNASGTYANTGVGQSAPYTGQYGQYSSTSNAGQNDGTNYW